MANISKAELKKHLKELEKEEVIEEVLKLFAKFSAVKEYYQMELGQDTKALVEQYKHKIKSVYFPSRGFGDPKASVIRKIISEFKKVSVFDYDVIDVLLYRVENGVAFTNAYGDIDMPFYSSIESSYEEALKLIAKNNLYKEFKERCGQIVSDTRGIGWGFHDYLADAYEEYFEEK